MLDSKVLGLAAERIAKLDNRSLAEAHERAHGETLVKSADGLSAHHLLSSELSKRGYDCPDTLPPLLVSSNDVTKKAFEAVKDSLPMDLVASLRQAFEGDATMASVITSLSAKGYDMEVVPRMAGDERTPEQMFADIVYPGTSEVEEPEDSEDEMETEGEGEMPEDEDEGVEHAGVLGRLLGAIAELLGGGSDVEKGYSFDVENSIINRNKRKSSAKTEHEFKAAKYKTRDGRVRCMTCGGQEPSVGKMCNKQPSAKLVFGKAGGDVILYAGDPTATTVTSGSTTSLNAGTGNYTVTYGKAKADSTFKNFTKADERRFTLGPMYIPNVEDAHGEWTDADELQQALWEYVRSGDRRIRLQHNRDVVAGEWVEVMTFPFPLTVPMLQADGTEEQMTYPANTVFMGIVWEPWAWKLVKEGKLRGLSIGGKAQRIDADIPEAEMEKGEPDVGSVHIDTPIGAYPKKPKEQY